MCSCIYYAWWPGAFSLAIRPMCVIHEWNHNTRKYLFIFTYYTDEPESTHVPPFLQWTWTHGVTPHWPTLRPKAGCPAGCPSTWNFLSLLVRNCTSKMQPLKENKHTEWQNAREGYFSFHWLRIIRGNIKCFILPCMKINGAQIKMWLRSELCFWLKLRAINCKHSSECVKWLKLISFIVIYFYHMTAGFLSSTKHQHQVQIGIF